MTITCPTESLSGNTPDSEAGAADPAETLERLAGLMAAAEAAEDNGQLHQMEALAREGLAHAITAKAADQVVDFYALLARRHSLADDWPNLLKEVEPGLAWLPRASDPVACLRLAGMLAVVYASYRQIDRAFGLLASVRARHPMGSGEAGFLLQVKLGELNLNLGRAGEAAVFLREALRLLDTCSVPQRTAHRRTITRLLLASSLLLTAMAARDAGSLDWAAPLDEVMQCLDEAMTTVGAVPVLAATLDVARGYCRSLRGQGDPLLKARLIGLSDEELVGFVAPTLPCLFDWVSAEAASGDLGFGRAVLARTDPRLGRLPWPHQKPLWYRTLGEVLAAEGDLTAAVQALRQSIVEDRRMRDSETSMVVQMAERAALADEIEERADRLAISNASLAAETQRLSEHALTDSLTGLRNRRGLEQFAARVRSIAAPDDWTVAMIDIDHFKSVNDQHSHAVGDKVLAAVGQILGAAVREDDIAARWGGEEFVLLLRHQVGELRLDAIRRSVESFDWASLLPDRRVTISLGAAVWSGRADLSDALALADQRLYAAKHAGRNRVVAA